LAISNTVRTITGSMGYTLEAMEELQTNMYPVLVATTSGLGTDPVADKLKALLEMSTTYE
ncbi:hypothetical protein FRC11_003209, partial [Ceratobasidium sp. 423]